MIGHSNHSLNDVVNKREVAPHPAVVEHIYGLVFEDRFGKEVERHVGASPRSIDGEEPQAGCRQLKQMAVSVGH